MYAELTPEAQAAYSPARFERTYADAAAAAMVAIAARAEQQLDRLADDVADEDAERQARQRGPQRHARRQRQGFPFSGRQHAGQRIDRRLAAVDIAGSLAHARMLAATGVLGREDLAAIERGMETIRDEIASGAFPWSREHEDAVMEKLS